MRQKLNENPVAQVLVIGFLLVAVGVFALSSMGGGEEEEPETAATEATAATTGEAVEAPIEATTEPGLAPASGSVPSLPADAPVPQPPAEVTAAVDAGRTVVLLFVRSSGIDDRLAAAAVRRVSGLPSVSAFVVPADEIASYAAIASGAQVDRVPALVVLSPEGGGADRAEAFVRYGFQSPESVVQTIVDAGYEGPTLAYHP